MCRSFWTIDHASSVERIEICFYQSNFPWPIVLVLRCQMCPKTIRPEGKNKGPSTFCERLCGRICLSSQYWYPVPNLERDGSSSSKTRRRCFSLADYLFGSFFFYFLFSILISFLETTESDCLFCLQSTTVVLKFNGYVSDTSVSVRVIWKREEKEERDKRQGKKKKKEKENRKKVSAFGTALSVFGSERFTWEYLLWVHQFLILLAGARLYHGS